MINARAARFFRLAGRPYAKGDPISISDNQFADLESIGLVERSPEPPQTVIAKVAVATRRTKRRSVKRTD